MPTVAVAPLTEAQIEDAGRALALAFQDDPLQCYVLPDPEERARRSPPRDRPARVDAERSALTEVGAGTALR